MTFRLNFPRLSDISPSVSSSDYCRARRPNLSTLLRTAMLRAATLRSYFDFCPLLVCKLSFRLEAYGRLPRFLFLSSLVSHFG